MVQKIILKTRFLYCIVNKKETVSRLPPTQSAVSHATFRARPLLREQNKIAATPHKPPTTRRQAQVRVMLKAGSAHTAGQRGLTYAKLRALTVSIHSESGAVPSSPLPAHQREESPP